MIKKIALLAATVALCASMASAATLQGLMDSSGTLTIGDKIFGEFGFGTSDPLLIQAENIGVNVTTIGGNYGLIFTSGQFVGPVSKVLDVTLQYSVWTSSGQPLINGIGQILSATGSGFVSIEESVFNEAFDQIAFSALALDDLGDGTPEAGDLLEFDPVKKVFVVKDYALRTGYDSAGNELPCLQAQNCTTVMGTSLIQFVRQGGDVPPIPEPATMLLFSTALLGLGFMRRKKS